MQQPLNWKAAVLAGIIAGIVFIMVEMALVAMLQGESPWGPPRMMAAIVMGKGVLPPPASFEPEIMMVAMLVHVMLSILLALVFGWAAGRFGFGLGSAIGIGALFGIAVYIVNFYGFTAAFPWFAIARGPISIFGHALFGAVLGGTYRLLQHRDVPAGMERPA